MFITIQEIFDIIIMTFAIGYIFSNYFKRQPEESYDPIKFYQKNQFLENIKLGIIIAAPAIVLHEIAHKIVAISFGATAILQAPIFWYIVVIGLMLIRFPLIFFVGGQVSILNPEVLSNLQHSLISFAGPFINLILYFLFVTMLRFRLFNKRYSRILFASAKLNLFLFGFNLIPIPGFDGYNILINILRLLGM
jgi:Zn-dependent protease